MLVVDFRLEKSSGLDPQLEERVNPEHKVSGFLTTLKIQIMKRLSLS